MEPVEMERSLILVIGPPRSGSTLLMRMLSSHSAIYSRAEPHLLTPLAHLGYYDTVDTAPFDHLQAQQSVREFVAELPGGEADY
ncbi:MAG: sulfotransferase, partial [Candidatus Binatia bacterium]